MPWRWNAIRDGRPFFSLYLTFWLRRGRIVGGGIGSWGEGREWKKEQERGPKKRRMRGAKREGEEE